MLNLNFIKLFALFFHYIYGKKLETFFLDNPKDNTKSYENSIYLKVSVNRNLIIFIKYFLYYLNIQIKNTYSNNLGHLAFYSKNDYGCMPIREQMSINPYGDSFMTINSSILISNLDDNNYPFDESFYLCVYCVDESLCDYIITFKLESSINIPNNINYFNYYEYLKHTTLDITFESNILNNNTFNENNKIYELFWIKRMNNNKFINYNYNLPENYNGILLKKMENEKDFTQFSISMNKGDYVTIGKSIIVGSTNKEPLKINDIETIGYLEKDILMEECFEISSLKGKNIDYLYIKGIIYDKIAQIYYKELNSEDLIGEKRIIERNFMEILTQEEINNGRRICISFLDESNKEYKEYESFTNIVFKIQLFSNEIKNYYSYFNTLDIPGSLYLTSLSYDEIMILSGIIKNKKKKISITLNAIFGYPKIYLDICRIFPFCKYEESLSLTNLDSFNINKMDNYSSYFKIKEENINLLDSYQPLIIIHCPFENGCLFEISYFSENDDIILKEDVLFNQYLFKEEKNTFIIDYNNYCNIKQIIIDITIFNGNIDIKLNYTEKFFIVNKYVYTIDLNSDELFKYNKILSFTIYDIINSYYSIKYNIIRENSDKNKIIM